MSIGKDYSNIPEIKRLYYSQDRNAYRMPGIKRIGEFIKALEETGEPIFKIRSSRMPVPEADLKDSWMDIQKAGWSIRKDWDTSMKGFNEVYICTSSDWEDLKESSKTVVETLRQLEREIFNYEGDSVDLVGAYYSLESESDRDKVAKRISQGDMDSIIDFLTRGINESLDTQDFEDELDDLTPVATPWGCDDDDYYLDDEDVTEGIWYEAYDLDGEDDDDPVGSYPWSFITSKSVKDYDGFWTDYSMWMEWTKDDEGNLKPLNHFVFIFGDNDIYNPHNSEPDWECDGVEEAQEWFDNYRGFEEDDDLELTDDDMNAGQWFESLGEDVDGTKFTIRENPDGSCDVMVDGKVHQSFPDRESAEEAGWVECKVISDELSLPEDMQLDERVAPDGYAPKQSGTAYKVFKVRNGKLYPPMVANAGGEDTPVGKWLEAEEGEFAGLSKTGRKQVKAVGGGNLSYRPGWHLGEIPRAPQFDRTNKETGEKEFPKDFVWAKCSYTMDIDYQPESDEQGYMRTKVDDEGNVTEYRSDKYQHSLAGLHKLPKDGYYKYRTNPRPDTVPWIITGAIKVDELLDDYQVNEILKKNGVEPIHRQGGDKTLKELGL